jgi:hypothetical protein
VEYRERNKRYFSECFLKEKTFVRYLVNSYKAKPLVEEVINDTRRFDCRSSRPYKAGQPCDGSISSPVMHLYNQLCQHHGICSTDLYNEAYPEGFITEKEIQQCIELAEWQGVEIITDWNRTNVMRVLGSLTEINHHMLRSELELRLEAVEAELSHFV